MNHKSELCDQGCSC